MSKVDDALLLDRQLCFSIYSTSLAMMQAYKPLLKSLDLTYPQYLVMLALWDRAPRSLNDLADELAMEPATLSPLVKRLEAQGRIERRRSSSDERMLEITLGQNPRWTIPVLEFQGAPTGIDVTKVCRTGILPQINTGMAGRVAGTGQVGAGLVTPPAECFAAALQALADSARG